MDFWRAGLYSRFMYDMHTARISNVEIVMCVVIKNDGFYFSQTLFNDTSTEVVIESVYINRVSILTGLSLRAGGWGFSLATMNVAPSNFHLKIEEK